MENRIFIAITILLVIMLSSCTADKAVQTAMVEKEEPSASPQAALVIEGQVESEPVLSPDGKYAISSRVDEETHIYEVLLYGEGGEQLINTIPIIGRDFGFLWSPDSTKVCISYSGRIWGDFSMLKVEQGSLLEHPSIADIMKSFEESGSKFDYKLNENRPDPYLTPLEWSPDCKQLLVFYTWYDQETKVQNGNFIFDTVNNRFLRLMQNPAAEADHPRIQKPVNFSW